MIFSFVNKNLFKLFFLLTCNIGYSQAVTRQYIDSVFKTIDTTFKQKRGVMYVINGIPYDSLNVDTALSKYSLKHLINLNFMTCEKAKLFHCYNDIGLVLFAYNQKDKTKRKAWKAAKQLFADAAKTPVLIIDNIVITPGSSKLTFKALRLKDIMYIDITKKENEQQIRIWKAN